MAEGRVFETQSLLKAIASLSRRAPGPTGFTFLYKNGAFERIRTFNINVLSVASLANWSTKALGDVGRI